MARTSKLSITNQNCIRILSFDPGMNNTGWAISNYNIVTKVFDVLKYGTIKASKMAEKQKELTNRHGKQIVAINILKQEITKLVIDSVPDYVASEDSFYNPKTPNAYRSLLLCLFSIDNILFNMYYYKEECNLNETASKLHKISPKTIKMVMSGTGNSFKVDMLEALKKQYSEIDITFSHYPNVPFEDFQNTLTEHSIDAVSCGFSFAKSIYPQLIV